MPRGPRTEDPHALYHVFSRGNYRTAIFTHDAAQLEAARRSLEALEKTKPFKDSIVTQIQPAGPFYAAEDHHQNYYKKNPVRYQYYRTGCGRDARLKQLWGKAGG